MEPQEWKKLLDKQVAGTATHEELDKLEGFADRLLEGQQHTPFTSDLEKRAIQQELRERIELRPAQSSIPWLRVAAAVAAILVVASGLWVGFQQWTTPDLLVIETGAGQTRTVQLMDGSTVELGFSSRLEYPDEFASDGRFVNLNGQALFTVAKDSERPFEVNSNGIVTRVLGTVFNVKAYTGDSTTTVSLLEGSVQVETEEQTALLVPKQQSHYDLRTGDFSTQPFDSAAVTAWRTGGIVLDRTPFDELQRLLTRRYGVTVTFEQREIAGYTISGKFTDPELKTLLDVVCAAKSLSYKESADGNILIYKPE